MKLLASATSPYARKLRIIAHALGLPLTLVETAPMEDGAALLAANPLGKVPVLLLDDGTAQMNSGLFDSRVISRYLLSLAPGNALLAADGPAHWYALTSEAMADGILDAAINLRFNAGQGVTTGVWVDRQYRAIDRALAALATRIGPGDTLTELCTMVACEYLDLRWPGIDWRTPHPTLAALQTRLTNQPAFATTRPPA
jgi:glutathione S-transferase